MQLIPPQLPEYDEQGRPLGAYRNMNLMPQQMIPPMIQPQVNPQQQIPDFTPIPIQKAAPTALEQEQANVQLPDRNDPQFKNSRLRTVLNAIAGGLAGASGGPKVGMEVGAELRDSKYNKAMDSYTNRLALIKQKLGTEKEQFGRSEKSVEEATKRAGIQGTLEVKRDVANTGAKRVDAYTKDVGSKIARRDTSSKLDVLKQANPKLSDYQKILSIEDPDEQEAAIDTYIQMHPKIDEDTKVETAGKVRAAQLKEEAKYGPAIAGAKAAAVDKVKAGTPLNPDQEAAVQGAITRSKANPDTVNDIVKQLDRKSQTKFWATYDGPTPRKLNTEEQKIATTAKTAIGHATNLLSYLKDPDIQASIGPIKGRISQLEQAIGGSFGKAGSQENNVAAKVNSVDLNKGLNPNDPKELKVAKFLDLLKYLVLFEASATSGTRPSWQLVRELKETQGPKFNIDRMMGNLEAAAESAGIRIKALYDPSSMGQPIKDEKSTGKYKYEIIK